MLLSTHYQLLLLAIKNNPNFRIEKNKEIFFMDKKLSEKNIEELVKGLFYPDLPCAYFFIKDNHIEMIPRLCSVLELSSLGKNITKNVRSQIEESHNGRYSINHSMTDNPDKTNSEIRDAIIARFIIIFYIFLVTKDYSYLGMILHSIHDSYSPVHSFRVKSDTNNNKTYTTEQMISSFENIKQITPPIDFTEINHLVLSDLVYNVLDDKKNIPVILSIIKEMNFGLSSNTNPDNPNNQQIDMTKLINKIIELMLSKSNNIDTQISILNLLLGYPDGIIKKSFFSNPFGEEKVPLKNINKLILLDNKINKKTIKSNINNILLPITIYDDLSHNLRRIYKICMNSLFNIDVLERIKNLQGGSSDGNGNNDGDNKYNIKSFLYYPDQNHDTHAIKDCGYVQLKYYKNTFLQAFVDTKDILNFCLKSIQNVSNNESIITSITLMYNFLMNNTYNMSPEDLDKNVSLSNNDKLEFTKLNPQFLKCVGDNLSLGIKNFKLDYNKIFDDLVNIDKQIPFSELEYKQKYIKYKQKYLMLKNKKSIW
jgi:hypothetical protein